MSKKLKMRQLQNVRLLRRSTNVLENIIYLKMSKLQNVHLLRGSKNISYEHAGVWKRVGHNGRALKIPKICNAAGRILKICPGASWTLSNWPRVGLINATQSEARVKYAARGNAHLIGNMF